MMDKVYGGVGEVGTHIDSDSGIFLIQVKSALLMQGPHQEAVGRGQDPAPRQHEGESC